MIKEPLTASRMAAFLSCQRKHFYRYEVCLVSASDKAYFRFGSAWHRAMAAHSTGKSYDEALAAACPEGIELTELEIATIAGLLAGYYAYYQIHRINVQFFPEQPFYIPIQHSNTFTADGVIDGLGRIDNQTILMEYKTSGEDIAPDSDYWLRLRFNAQVFQYVLAARHHGWNIEKVVYDVVRKPCIAPKQISILDEQGCKIVQDVSGQRIFKKDGSPRESGDTEKGWFVQTREETPEQFGQRLAEDTKARPEFYFQRREVPILDQDLIEFETQRLIIARSILTTRYAEKKVMRREQAWPRNISAITCKTCEYNTFCLQNISLDPAHLPAGLTVGNPNPELPNHEQ